MTDNEIIKALHICAEHEPFEGQQYTYCGIPLQLLFKEILAFVNRKKAEIERLKEYPKCVYEYDGDLTDFCLKSPCSNYKTVEQIKAEAIKKFAKQAKHRLCLSGDYLEEFENLVQEMVGDDNAEN